MSLLLDTHTLVWALAEPEKLPPRVADAITSPRNAVYASAVSTWELAIKAGLGRIELPVAGLERSIAAAGFDELPVTLSHTLRVRDLPNFHHDLFDRLLIAQALEEGLRLVSGDAALRPYPVRIFWA